MTGKKSISSKSRVVEQTSDSPTCDSARIDPDSYSLATRAQAAIVTEDRLDPHNLLAHGVLARQYVVIGEEDLPERMPEVRARESKPVPTPAASLKRAVEELERQMIAEMLRATGNNQQKTAKALGLSRQGLINKLKRYGLNSSDTRLFGAAS